MSARAYRTLVLGACALLLSAGALAQASRPGAGPVAAPASGSLGAGLAARGAPERNVAACVGCHGAQGEGMAAAGFPRLAGLSPAYLLRQLESFAGDSRQNPVMSPIAKALTPAEARAVADYYGGLPVAAAAAPPPAPAPASDRGLRLASVGDDRIQVQACANCHGPGGRGEPPATPPLAGQPATYLTNALAAWKSGARRNDPSGQMPHIAAALSDDDVQALSAYYAAQPATPPLPGLAAQRPAAMSRTTGRSGNTAPREATPPHQGVGTEAGTPLTGGSQGNSGGGSTTPAPPSAPSR